MKTQKLRKKILHFWEVDGDKYYITIGHGNPWNNFRIRISYFIFKFCLLLESKLISAKQKIETLKSQMDCNMTKLNNNGKD